MNSRIARYGSFVLVCALSSAVARGEGPSFRLFSGVNAGLIGTPDYQELWQNSLSMNRSDLSWSSYEPTQYHVDTAWWSNFLANASAYKANNATLLPILAYNAEWSWDRSEREWISGNTKFSYTPLGGDRFTKTTYTNVGGNWIPGGSQTVTGNIFWPLAPQKVNAWKNFVTNTVATLRSQPYDLKYIQVWNEMPTFWVEGSRDSFFDLVHKPAAGIIRSLGGKVVFNGWNFAPSSYVSLLDANQAWDSIDVHSIHYRSLADMNRLYNEMVARGYGDQAIWQTELGWTPDAGYIGNFYPRALRWALDGRGWQSNPDKFKLLYFNFRTGSAAESNLGLYYGGELTPHGTSLKTLGNLLDGDSLDISDVPFTTNISSFQFEIDESRSSVESFTIDDRQVFAFHVTPGDNRFNGVSQILLTLPSLSAQSISSVFRVDAAGFETNLQSAVQSLNPGIRISIPVANDPSSPISSWNLTGQPKTFYLSLTFAEGIAGDYNHFIQPPGNNGSVQIPEPASGLLLMTGFFVMCFRRRARFQESVIRRSTFA